MELYENQYQYVIRFSIKLWDKEALKKDGYTIIQEEADWIVCTIL